jgi:WD40 repeat protein
MNRDRVWLVVAAWMAFVVLLWLSQRLVPRATTLTNIPKQSNWHFSRDGGLFYFGDEEQVRVYDVRTGALLANWRGSIFAVGQVVRITETAILACAMSEDGLWRIINLVDGREVLPIGIGAEVVQFELSPNGRFVAVQRLDDRVIRLWSTTTKQLVASFDYSSESGRVRLGSRPIHIPSWLRSQSDESN